MGVTIGTGIAQWADVRRGAVEAALEARDGLGGAPADLAVVFAAGAYLSDPAETLAGVHEGLDPAALIGCGAGGVLHGGREVEAGTAVAVWAASLDGGTASTFHAYAEPAGEDTMALVGLPELAGASGAILLPDPYTFPTDPVLREVAARAPGVPILGGLASARAGGGRGAVLFRDDDVLDAGGVGVRLDGVELLPCVSQGATPLGPELTITAAEGHVITELAGRPALEKLREVVLSLPADERDSLITRGLLLGLVIDGGKPDYVQGDFLVRGLVAADPDDGTIAVGADVAPGQVVRLHARDAGSADRDLREALELRRTALGGAPAGALVFTCNGRGRGMFGEPDHDASAIGEELAGAPAVGFFAAGEIGPVGGESFLHGFTATLAVFAR